jgi:hypothetical protein
VAAVAASRLVALAALAAAAAALITNAGLLFLRWAQLKPQLLARGELGKQPTLVAAKAATLRLVRLLLLMVAAVAQLAGVGAAAVS